MEKTNRRDTFLIEQNVKHTNRIQSNIKFRNIVMLCFAIAFYGSMAGLLVLTIVDGVNLTDRIEQQDAQVKQLMVEHDKNCKELYERLKKKGM